MDRQNRVEFQIVPANGEVEIFNKEIKLNPSLMISAEQYRFLSHFFNFF